jgi:hypothetical protein
MLSNKIKNMKNIVSFETAKKLEAARFERPTPGIGQFWYLFGEKEPTLIIPKQDHKKAGYYNCDFILNELDGVCEVDDVSIEIRGIYAPTATDLLEAMGSDFVLWYDKSPKLQMWYCAETSDIIRDTKAPYGNENAAEAVAEAFLLQAKQ